MLEIPLASIHMPPATFVLPNVDRLFFLLQAPNVKAVTAVANGPTKSQSTTKLPKIVSRTSLSTSRSSKDDSTTSLPPLSATSGTSMVCVGTGEMRVPPESQLLNSFFHLNDLSPSRRTRNMTNKRPEAVLKSSSDLRAMRFNID